MSNLLSRPLTCSFHTVWLGKFRREGVRMSDWRRLARHGSSNYQKDSDSKVGLRRIVVLADPAESWRMSFEIKGLTYHFNAVAGAEFRILRPPRFDLFQAEASCDQATVRTFTGKIDIILVL